MPMSKLAEVEGWTWTWQKPIYLIVRSKVNIESGFWMYTTPNHGPDTKTCQIPINLTLRSIFKVISESWMYAKHRLMVIHPCAKYGKPMSDQKIVMGRTRICTDRWTDKWTDRVISIYPPELRSQGYNYTRFGIDLYWNSADCMN